MFVRVVAGGAFVRSFVRLLHYIMHKQPTHTIYPKLASLLRPIPFQSVPPPLLHIVLVCRRVLLLLLLFPPRAISPSTLSESPLYHRHRASRTKWQ